MTAHGPNGAAGKSQAKDTRACIRAILADGPRTLAQLVEAVHFATPGQVRSAVRHEVAAERVVGKGGGRLSKQETVYYLASMLIAEAVALSAGSRGGRRAVPRHGRVTGSRAA